MQSAADFERIEEDWRARLAGRSLVVEANIDPAEAERAFSILGQNFGRFRSRPERLSLLKRYRAALAAGLCAVGGRVYDDGIFWPRVAEAFGQPDSQSLQIELAEAFRASLTLHRLSRFTTPMRNVGEILMHSGIPTPSLEGYLRVLLRLDAATPGLDGRSVSSWAHSMGTGPAAAASGLDAPTWRFLSEGGEIAEDFTDRCLELVDQFRSRDTPVASAVSLPSHVVAEIDRLLSSGDFDTTSAARRGSRPREEQMVPRIAFSAGEGVQLILPPLQVMTETAIAWRISAEGSVSHVSVAAPWPGDPVKPIARALRPAKVISLRLSPGDQEWELDLVDTDDPLLVFDAVTGEWTPPRNSLPNGQAWLVFPNREQSQTQALLEADGELRELGQMDSPHGWEGWTFVHADLTGVSKLRLLGNDRWRYVSTITRPRVNYGVPVAHVTSLDGSPIYSTKPTVTLPASPEGTVEWIVSVYRHGKEAPLATSVFESDDTTRMVDPWPETIELVSGAYDVRVRGPLGRGTNAPVFIVEGLASSATVPFRSMLPTGNGLTPATVALLDPHGTHSVELDQSATFVAHTLREDTDPVAVIVALPHMSVTQHSEGMAPITTIRPQRIESESLSRVQLRVAVPADVRAELAVTAGNQLLQTIRAGSTGRGYAQFNLAQISNTLGNLPSAMLTLVMDGEGVPVGSVHPKRLATSAAVKDGVLSLTTMAPVTGLRGGIYPNFAPWLPPYEVTFDDENLTVELPSEVLAEGQATLVLRVEDPWVPEPWPEQPPGDATNSFDLRLGAISGAKDSDAGFRRWLAMGDDCPSEPPSLSTAVKLYPLLGRVRTPKFHASLRHELAKSIRENRSGIFEAVLDTTTSSAALTRMFVHSEIATLPVATYIVPQSIWSTSVLLGVLGGAALAEGNDPRYRDALARHAGASALEILDEGHDPFSTIGRFGPAVIPMHPWPQDRVDDLWEKAAPTPGGLLDKDPRATAGKSLFDVRRHRGIAPLANSSSQTLARVQQFVSDALGTKGIRPITDRTSEEGWASLPAVSIALALAARLSARGYTAAEEFFKEAHADYTELAHLAPAIVEQDLVLAELWVSAHRKESWKR